MEIIFLQEFHLRWKQSFDRRSIHRQVHFSFRKKNVSRVDEFNGGMTIKQFTHQGDNRDDTGAPSRNSSYEKRVKCSCCLWIKSSDLSSMLSSWFDFQFQQIIFNIDRLLSKTGSIIRSTKTPIKSSELFQCTNDKKISLSFVFLMENNEMNFF